MVHNIQKWGLQIQSESWKEHMLCLNDPDVFYSNKTNLTAVVYFCLCVICQILLSPRYNKRDALAIISLNTDAYSNLDFCTVEQNDKHTLAVLTAVVHSCFASLLIFFNWWHVHVGSTVLLTMLMMIKTMICTMQSNRTWLYWGAKHFTWVKLNLDTHPSWPLCAPGYVNCLDIHEL